MVGRNDSCPCGSGKKYKKCCLNENSTIEVKPSNQPENINYHLVKHGGEWLKKPGLLKVMLHTVDIKDMDTEIEDIFKDIVIQFGDIKYQELKDKLHNCKHKLYAVRHYKLSIEKEIKLKVGEFENDYQAHSGVEIERENRKLVYETESFLFQVKSSLDLLTQALGYILPCIKSFRTFKHSGEGGNFIAGGKVIAALNKEDIKVGSLLEENRKLWIQGLVIMRDTITHYSRLKNFYCFVEEPYIGKEKVGIHYPSMPTGERVDNYCREIYENLLNLYKATFIFFYTPPKKNSSLG